MNADDFLRASILVRLLAVPDQLKTPFYQSSLARYEPLYVNSPRRHDCPFCRMLIRRHKQDWAPVREHIELILSHGPPEAVATQLRQIREVGDYFAQDEQ